MAEMTPLYVLLLISIVIAISDHSDDLIVWGAVAVVFSSWFIGATQ